MTEKVNKKERKKDNFSIAKKKNHSLQSRDVFDGNRSVNQWESHKANV